MPVTHLTFLIACLAIAGIFPFAGFFSKEEILTAALHANKVVYGIALVTTGITAFYMFRLYFNIFWSKESTHDNHHHGEGTLTMKIPLILLAIGAATTGFIPFGEFVTNNGKPYHSSVDIAGAIGPVLVALTGIGIAMLLYKKQNDRPEKMATTMSGLYVAAYRKFYIDEIYLFITRKIVFNIIGKSSAWFDRTIIDGSMNGLATVVEWKSNLIKNIQSGKIQDYALYFFVGVFGLTLLAIYLVN